MVSGKIISMKKLFLLVGLVVLFFAQSSYAEKKVGFKTGNVYEIYTIQTSGVTEPYSLDNKIYFSKRKSIEFMSRNKRSCFNAKGDTYFNIYGCEIINFYVRHEISKKHPYKKIIKKYINEIASDICEDPIIVYEKKITHAKFYYLGNTRGIIKCTKVLANREKREEDKKLAKEEELKKEKENKLASDLVSMQEKQKTCSTLGFEMGTEANGNCVLKMMQMEIDLNKIEEQKTVYVENNDSSNVAKSIANQALRQQQLNSSLLLMQQGLNLMAPKPRVNCLKTFTGFTCN